MIILITILIINSDNSAIRSLFSFVESKKKKKCKSPNLQSIYCSSDLTNYTNINTHISHWIIVLSFWGQCTVV